MLHIRVDDQLEAEATAKLADVGLTVSGAGEAWDTLQPTPQDGRERRRSPDQMARLAAWLAAFAAAGNPA